VDSSYLESARHTIFLGDSLAANYGALALVFFQPDETNEFDFTGTQVFKVKARGAGNMLFKIWSPLLDSVSAEKANGVKYLYYAGFTLTENWKVHELTLADFRISNNEDAESIEVAASLPLSSVLGKVRKIELLTALENPLNQEYEFDLESIALEGISQGLW